MAHEDAVDLVVIGAGWYGLASAKTYLEVNPTANLILLDEASTVGGVWAKSRHYPGLKTNNLLGAYEYSDFPLDKSKYQEYGLVTEGRPLPAAVVHQYLSDYSKTFGVHERIRFNSKVESCEHKEGGGWVINISGGSKIVTSKLIVATGLTSDPFVPVIAGSETFEPPLFHSREFKDYAGTIDPAKTASICVLGGTKSAWDVVYAYATKGVQVDWIIRESGHGPTWMSPPYVTPLKKWLEGLTQTRFLTWLSPSIWAEADGYSTIRSFFHGTTVGRYLVDTFWKILASDVVSLNKYDDHPETAKLKPWTNPFFIASSLSILNYDTNFFDVVLDGKARVHIADITSLDKRAVNLSNGETLNTDAFVCCTGWKHTPPIKFLPADLDLGLPHPRRFSEPSKLIARADKEVLEKFPRLKDQPKPNPKLNPLEDAKKTAENEQEPYRLYRFMIPPAFIESRDIAFAGSMLTITTTVNAQTQALWITAFFGGQVKVDSDPVYSTILHSTFMKWRTPSGFGSKFPDMVFDALSYTSMLLNDLGLSCHRKGGALAEIFSPYAPEDYKGLTSEWLTKQANGKLHAD